MRCRLPSEQRGAPSSRNAVPCRRRSCRHPPRSSPGPAERSDDLLHPGELHAEQSQQVKDAGLLNRRRPYYVVSIALTVLAFAGVWVAIVAVGDSWWQLGLAVLLSLVCTQFGFLGHDTAHRQAFGSHRVNEWSARGLSCGFAGIGYGRGEQKHNPP